MVVPQGECPEFDPYDPGSVEKILEWSGAVVGRDENLGLWGFSWAHGFVTFGGVKEEGQARAAAALFVYLWHARGVKAELADLLADAYARVYKV